MKNVIYHNTQNIRDFFIIIIIIIFVFMIIFFLYSTTSSSTTSSIKINFAPGVKESLVKLDEQSFIPKKIIEDMYVKGFFVSSSLILMMLLFLMVLVFLVFGCSDARYICYGLCWCCGRFCGCSCCCDGCYGLLLVVVTLPLLILLFVLSLFLLFVWQTMLLLLVLWLLFFSVSFGFCCILLYDNLELCWNHRKLRIFKEMNGITLKSQMNYD